MLSRFTLMQLHFISPKATASRAPPFEKRAMVTLGLDLDDAPQESSLDDSSDRSYKLAPDSMSCTLTRPSSHAVAMRTASPAQRKTRIEPLGDCLPIDDIIWRKYQVLSFLGRVSFRVILITTLRINAYWGLVAVRALYSSIANTTISFGHVWRHSLRVYTGPLVVHQQHCDTMWRLLPSPTADADGALLPQLIGVRVNGWHKLSTPSDVELKSMPVILPRKPSKLRQYPAILPSAQPSRPSTSHISTLPWHPAREVRGEWGALTGHAYLSLLWLAPQATLHNNHKHQSQLNISYLKLRLLWSLQIYPTSYKLLNK